MKSIISKDSIIYISGPISDNPSVNGPKFDRMKEYLKNEYHPKAILSPWDTPPGLSQSAYMDISLAQIRASTVIVTIPGWTKSIGCKAEIAYAEKLGMPIVHLSHH